MAIQKSGGDSSSLNQPQSLRETRVEQRRNYTDACQSKGADGEGIRRGTNEVYKETFGGKPKGDRDSWNERQQQEIAVSENFAANKVRSLPNSGDSQSEANDRVVQASGEGAKSAREYIDDQSENGNWWSRLF
jgi:hypothetical protein